MARPAHRSLLERSEGTPKPGKQWSATGPSRSARLGTVPTGPGVSAPRISGFIPLTPQAIRKVGHRYQEGGLERALYEKPRPGAAEVLDDNEK